MGDELTRAVNELTAEVRAMAATMAARDETIQFRLSALESEVGRLATAEREALKNAAGRDSGSARRDAAMAGGGGTIGAALFVIAQTIWDALTHQG